MSNHHPACSIGHPLRVGPTGRYLVDGMGRPVLVHGDTAWSLVSGLTVEEAETYLRNRAEKGFNAIIVNLVEHKFKGPQNRYGQRPFTTADDLSTPNEAYFAHADRVIAQAGALGIHVFLAPIYLGYKKAVHDADEGWYYEALASGVERCRAYGRYLGQRYAAHPHIVWLMGGDRDPEGALDHVNAVAQGIAEYDDQHLFTAHCAPEHSAVAQYGQEGWLDLNTTYTYEIVHRRLLADYQRQPAMPYVLIESTYEGEHNASAVQIRRQAYWALLCGAAGQFMGNRPIWLFDPGWREAMDRTASWDMVRLHALFTALPWPELLPDSGHRLFTGGLGEFRGLDYLAAARTADGRVAAAYMPTARAITIDLGQMVGQAISAWWYDPRTGLIHAEGEHPGGATWEIAPPGDGDWVLVLHDTALPLAAPGAG